jgi:hypothetical protein
MTKQPELLDKKLGEIMDSLREFPDVGDIYFFQVCKIIEDCYRLQDNIREDLIIK